MNGIELDRWAEVPFRACGATAGRLRFTLRAVDCCQGFNKEIIQYTNDLVVIISWVLHKQPRLNQVQSWSVAEIDQVTQPRGLRGILDLSFPIQAHSFPLLNSSPYTYPVLHSCVRRETLTATSQMGPCLWHCPSSLTILHTAAKPHVQ